MNYGKIINGNLELLKMPLMENNKDIFTNDKNIILQNGYKPVEYSEPEQKEGFLPVCSFIEKEDKILQVWNYEVE